MFTIFSHERAGDLEGNHAEFVTQGGIRVICISEGNIAGYRI